jgi:hypothetical protein
MPFALWWNLGLSPRNSKNNPIFTKYQPKLYGISQKNKNG